MATATLNLKDLFDEGFYHGQKLFQYNVGDVNITEDMEFDEFSEKVFVICNEADDGYRQYSPFEFFANELNEAENSDEAWEAYDSGIASGIEKELDDFFTAFEELKREFQDQI